MKKRIAVKSYALRSTMAKRGALQRSVEEETTFLISRSNDGLHRKRRGCVCLRTLFLGSRLRYASDMTLSARNQLKGTVEEIQLDGVMAHVAVRVGENLIESVITRRSAEEMALKQGDAVKVVIKSTEVMLQKD
jgi:molybdopterin-binding protein